MQEEFSKRFLLWDFKWTYYFYHKSGRSKFGLSKAQEGPLKGVEGMDAAESVERGFANKWRQHLESSPGMHFGGLHNELDGRMTLNCKVCGELGRAPNPLSPKEQGRVHELFEKILEYKT